MTETESTTLSEFVGSEDTGDSTECNTTPTPAENAADIERLADLMQNLTDQVGTLTDELEQQTDESYSSENNSDPEGMFQ